MRETLPFYSNLRLYAIHSCCQQIKSCITMAGCVLFRGAPFFVLWKLLLFHHLLQDVCHIILVDAGSFIVLHVCVLSALRHSYRGLSCFLMIRSRTFFDGSKGFVLFSKEYKKPNLSPIGKKFGFCSEKRPLHVLKPCTYSPTNKIALSPTDLMALVCATAHQKSSLGGVFYLMP